MFKNRQDELTVVEETPEALEAYQRDNRLHGFGVVRISAGDLALLQEGKTLACHDGEYATFVRLDHVLAAAA